MRPTSSTTISRPDLAAMAMEYALDASQRGFVGLEAMPLFETALQTAEYPVIPTEALLKVIETERAPRSAYRRDDWEFENDHYACSEHGLEGPLDDGERRKYEGIYPALHIEEITVKRTVDKILRAQEKRIAEMLFNETNITAGANATAVWSSASTAKPKADIRAGFKAVRQVTGLRPTHCIMGADVFDYLIETDEVQGRYTPTKNIYDLPFEAQVQAMSNYVGAQILVGDAVVDSTGKNKSFSAQDVWSDDYVLLFVAAKSKDLEEPCLGRTFLWTTDSPDNPIVEEYRENQTRSDVFRVRHSIDECFMMPATGYLIKNVTS